MKSRTSKRTRLTIQENHDAGTDVGGTLSWMCKRECVSVEEPGVRRRKTHTRRRPRRQKSPPTIGADERRRRPVGGDASAERGHERVTGTEERSLPVRVGVQIGVVRESETAADILACSFHIPCGEDRLEYAHAFEGGCGEAAYAQVRSDEVHNEGSPELLQSKDGVGRRNGYDVYTAICGGVQLADLAYAVVTGRHGKVFRQLRFWAGGMVRGDPRKSAVGVLLLGRRGGLARAKCIPRPAVREQSEVQSSPIGDRVDESVVLRLRNVDVEIAGLPGSPGKEEVESDGSGYDRAVAYEKLVEEHNVGQEWTQTMDVSGAEMCGDRAV